MNFEFMTIDTPLPPQLRAYRALYYYILFDLFRNIPLDTTYDHPTGWHKPAAPDAAGRGAAGPDAAGVHSENA